MPVTTIPLVGKRGNRIDTSGAKDQRFTNTIFDVVTDQLKGEVNVHVMKRVGIDLAATVDSGGTESGLTGYVSRTSNKMVSIFFGTVPRVWHGTITGSGTDCGQMDGTNVHISESVINGVVNFLFTTSNGTAWYMPEDAVSASATFTGDTHTNTTIDNVSSLTGLYVGQLISGTGIQAGTRIATITSPSTITTTLATTATNSTVTITREHLGKMTGVFANFPTSVSGKFVELDGFLFIAGIVGTTPGVFNSGLNMVGGWTSGGYIPTETATGGANALTKYKSIIICLGNYAMQCFENRGNPSNSPLVNLKEQASAVGIRSGIIPYAIIRDTTFWCAAPDGANCAVYMNAGLTPKRISTPQIERLMGANTYAISAVEMYGYTFVVARNTSGAEFGCFLYCVERDIWNDLSFAGSSIGFDLFGHNNGAYWIGQGVSGTNGKVFKFNSNSGLLGSAVFQDNGQTLTMSIQTETKVLNKGKGFVIKSVELLADNQASGSTSLSISGNDYGSFQTIGSFDLTATRKKLFRCGYYTSHAAFKLEDSGNNAWRGQALIVDWEPCNT